MAKEGYKPTAGMQSAARRAIKLKEQGKAKGAGTVVGWTRAGQLARGETLSLSTVKRMYSFFSRHEVDKKGKDWDNAENPSNGKIMWLAWGGDAGFSWSRAIVNREKNAEKAKFTTGAMVSWNSSGGKATGKIVRIVSNGKINVPDSSFTITGTKDDPAALIRLYKDGKPTDTLVGHKVSTLKSSSMKKSLGLDSDELVDEIKSILEDVVDPITAEIEEPVQDELDLEKSLRPEVTKEQMYSVIEHLMEAVEAMLEMPEEEEEEEESPEMESPENPMPVGNEIEDANNMQNSWPIAKAYENCGCETCKANNTSCEDCPECSKEMSKSYESDNEDEDKWDNVEKACWSGYEQRGMKDKGGRKVPNCVYVGKAQDLTEADQVTKSLFGFMDPYDLMKRKFTSAQRKKMAEEGKAMPDGSFPIANKTDLMNAIRSWGRGGSDPKVKEHIKRRAKALDAADMIPENWK